MNENDKDPQDFNILEEKSNYFFQVDFLKALMILLVIIDHSLAYSATPGLGLQLWERIAIPIFLIIMGFNMGKSFVKEGEKSLKELYSWNYFKKKFWRYVYPYIVLYFVGIIFGFILYGTTFPDTFKENWFLEYIVFQKSLLEGPGNWFIPIVFQSIFLMPLLYKAFTKWPKLSLISCFIIEFFMHLIVFFVIGEVNSINDFLREVYFRYIILLYISALGMGIWFSQDHNLFSKRNLFIWILFPFSTIYMIAWDFYGFRLAIDGANIIRGDYNYITFIYSAFIFLIAMKYIPQNSKTKIAKIFSAIGKATFHIYLTQDIYFIISYIIHTQGSADLPTIANIFGIVSTEFLVNILLIILNWIICIPCGVIWWYVDNKIRKLRLDKRV